MCSLCDLGNEIHRVRTGVEQNDSTQKEEKNREQTNRFWYEIFESSLSKVDIIPTQMIIAIRYRFTGLFKQWGEDTDHETDCFDQLSTKKIHQKELDIRVNPWWNHRTRAHFLKGALFM